MTRILLVLLLATRVCAGDDAGARFSASPPGHVEVGPGQQVAVSLEAGDFDLGTLTLTTSPDFGTDTEARIDIVRISLGPSSTDRDVFDTDA